MLRHILYNEKTYSGAMYPNVPIKRVGKVEFPFSTSFVKPKSPTCEYVIYQLGEQLFQFVKKQRLEALIRPLHGSFCLSEYLLI